MVMEPPRDTIQYRVKDGAGGSIELALINEMQNEHHGTVTWSLAFTVTDADGVYTRGSRSITVPGSSDHLTVLSAAIDKLRSLGVPFSLVSASEQNGDNLQATNRIVASSAKTATIRIDQVREGDEIVHRGRRRRVLRVKQVSLRTYELTFGDNNKPPFLNARGSTQVECIRGGIT